LWVCQCCDNKSPSVSFTTTHFFFIWHIGVERLYLARGTPGV
jgi:hypothetical protein